MNKTIFIFVSLVFATSGSAFAADRDLPGIDLIDREMWWAEENWRLADHPYYTYRSEQNDAFSQWLNTGAQTANIWFTTRVNTIAKHETANEWLLHNHPHEIDIQDHGMDRRWPYLDGIVTTHDGYELRWPQTYKDDKTKIIIHHTAWAHEANSISEAKPILQDIMTQHTFTNGRWDIGYHFLIDSAGNVYEGRAGWEWVIGAHTKRNNSTSIGVALIGNFETSIPSVAMRSSLTKLVTSLTRKYNISPYAEVPYFKASDNSPFVSAILQESIIGHTHAWATSCPGEHVIDILPTLRSQVQALLTQFRVAWAVDFSQMLFLDTPRPGFTNTNQVSFSFPFPAPWEPTCHIDDPNTKIHSCVRDGSDIIMTLDHVAAPASGKRSVVIQVWDKIGLGEVMMLRSQDLNFLLQDRIHSYTSVYGKPINSAKTTKITRPIDATKITELVQTPVRVLLYELTSAFGQRDISCSDTCMVTIDDQTQWARQLSILKFVDRLEIVIDGQAYVWSKLHISNPSWIISFQNYGRASYADIPWNRFRWDISIVYDQYRHLQQDRVNDRVVINTLPFESYLKGIAETSDQDHIEKVKAIYLAVKNYTAHYLDGSNTHPFVPKWWLYTMIDDPRMMQKYVGYGYELTASKRFEVFRSLRNTWITYDDQIVILPYFHCSPWFTRSGYDRFGWTDTPWLRSVLDVTTCPDTKEFSWGHGVGMSGLWAQRMASAGVKFDEILKWYYSGIELQ